MSNLYISTDIQPLIPEGGPGTTAPTPAPPPQAPPVPIAPQYQQANRTNPLLQSLRLPGETVRLPSRALTYTTDQVDPEVLETGEVHVHPMTTFEELLMKSPDMLFTGQAIVQTFTRCVPQIRNPMELLAKDVDFLLVSLRKLTYGPVVDVTFTHNCDQAQEHNYKVNIREFMQKNKEVNPEEFATLRTVTVESGQRVVLRPFLLQDFVTASQRAATHPNLEDMTEIELVTFTKEIIIDNLVPAIERVDDVTDQAFIKQWLQELPPPWLNSLSEVVRKINAFGLEFDVDTTCKDCGEKVTVTVPLNPQSFFTTPSEQETLK